MITDPTSMTIDTHGFCKADGSFVAQNPAHPNPYKYGFEYNGVRSLQDILITADRPDRSLHGT